jgi:RNA polymerase sigma factor (TIGR02999 family)
MRTPREGDVTRALGAAAAGDDQAAAELLRLVYSELRELARARMAKTPPGNTLQPTALVHEAYLRLIGKDDPKIGESRGHFFAAAAQAMRDILVEQARRKKRQKRGGGRKRIDLDGADLAAVPLEPPVEDILALDEALQKLEQDEPRLVEVVKLRFFAGLTTKETAAALGISVPTVERDWRFARTLLYTQLGGSQPDS